MDSDSCPNSDRLNDFVTGKLALELHDAVEEHLDQCAACQETVEILDDESKTFFAGLKQAPATPEARFEPDLQELVDRARALGAERSPQAENAELKDWAGPRPPLASGTALGNYVLEEPIGGGNMGFVYKAYHKRMKRDVALKFIAPHLVQSYDARRRFQREIEAAAKLKHPNVVTAYDADEVDGYCFLAQELVSGSDLREVVRQAGPLPLDRALITCCTRLEDLNMLTVWESSIGTSNHPTCCSMSKMSCTWPIWA